MKQLANRCNFQGQCCLLLTEGFENERKFVGGDLGASFPEKILKSRVSEINILPDRYAYKNTKPGYFQVLIVLTAISWSFCKLDTSQPSYILRLVHWPACLYKLYSRLTLQSFSKAVKQLNTRSDLRTRSGSYTCHVQFHLALWKVTLQVIPLHLWKSLVNWTFFLFG